MGKSTISMAIFNSYVKLPEGTQIHKPSPMFPPQHILVRISRKRDSARSLARTAWQILRDLSGRAGLKISSSVGLRSKKKCRSNLI